MLNAKTVATQLGLSARKIYELAHSGKLVSYRFGDAVRFEQADVDAYKAACKVVVLTVTQLEYRAPRRNPRRAVAHPSKR